MGQNMGEVHDILEAKGREGALQAGLERAIVDAASAYMGDEDNALGFVYAGWAQCAKWSSELRQQFLGLAPSFAISKTATFLRRNHNGSTTPIATPIADDLPSETRIPGATPFLAIRVPEGRANFTTPYR
jgi:hypothetical protein